VSWNLRDVTVLWRFNERSDCNLDVVVLLRRRSEGGMNSLIIEGASVVKVVWGGFGGTGIIVWTSVVSHVGRTAKVFKVTVNLQTFLFQMVVT
jgi:hypothetical protein